MKLRTTLLVLAVNYISATLYYRDTIHHEASTAIGAKMLKTSVLQLNKLVPQTLNRSARKLASTKTHNIADQVKNTQPALDKETHDLLCALKSARLTAPTDGATRIRVMRISKFTGENANNVAWIKSNSCPEGTYSIVYFSDEGHVSQEKDCCSTTPTELASLSGEQGDVNELSPQAGETNLAISGNGYFVLSCPGGGVILTRDGKFRQDSAGQFIGAGDCTLLNQNGSSLKNSNIDNSGCNSDGECVATVDPAFDDVIGLAYLNNHSFYADGFGPLSESVTRNGPRHMKPFFFVNALEDVHNPEWGLTSVSWSQHPAVNLQELECP